MIVLNVTYRCRPGMRDAFLRSIRDNGIDSASRAEEGNVRYDYFISVNGGDDLLLLEKWRDTEAFEVHRGQSHFALLGEINSSYVLNTDIEKYEI